MSNPYFDESSFDRQNTFAIAGGAQDTRQPAAEAGGDVDGRVTPFPRVIPATEMKVGAVRGDYHKQLPDAPSIGRGGPAQLVAELDEDDPMTESSFAQDWINNNC